ncbi:MAG: matrixin family metalloprotease [Actinomycetota bacterium]
MRLGRLIFIAAIATVLLFGSSALARAGYYNSETIDSARGCPTAKTCSIYALEGYRLPVANHRATIRFAINPVQPFMTSQQAVAGILAAAQTWARADPSVQVDYRGTTSAVVTSGDGVNEIGWGVMSAETLATTNIRSFNGKIVEADIVLNSLYVWSWSPCVQQNGSCEDVSPVGGVVQPAYDIQDVLTHEFGHWLGLGHVQGNATSELTMSMVKFPGERKGDTLADGDVAGVRALYPCKCKHAAIFEP